MQKGEKKLLTTLEYRRLGEETYEAMDEATRKIVDDTMYATIHLINSYDPEHPTFFYEAVAWRMFKWEMLGHMKNGEGWHVEDKCWTFIDEQQ